MFFIFIVLLLLVGCASVDPNSSETTTSGASATKGETKAIEPASIPGFNEVEFQQTQFFQRWVKGELSDEEKKSAIQSCQKRRSSQLFCASILAHRFFDKHIPSEPEIAPAKPPNIPDIVWEGKRIKDWKNLRKQKVSLLVKGLEKFPKEEILRVADLASKESRCPNQMAAAVAARFEDFGEPGLLPRAAQLFEKAGRCAKRSSPDREQLLTRAALLNFRIGRYSDSLRQLTRLEPQDALGGRPLYWKIRCELQLGRRAQAKKSLERLIGRYPFSFHGLIARYQFQKDLPNEWFAPGAEPLRKSKRNSKANLAIKEIELCAKYRFTECQQAIAQYALQKLKKVESEFRIFIASFAHPEIRIQSLQEVVISRRDLRHRLVFELLYPRPYQTLFEGQKSAEPALLYAIARKESIFNEKAVSSAQAVGLLQIQLPTAKRFRSDAEFATLLLPENNIPIGAQYVGDLARNYSNDLVAILASYNAGEEALARWKGRYADTDPLLFLDLIPYRETRDYVGYVLSNLIWYRRLYYGDMNPAQSLFPSGAIAIQTID